MRNRVWVAVAIVCGLLVAGCSADVEPLTTSPQGAGGEAGFSVLSSLAQIPLSAADDATSGLQVSVADLDAAADQARLRRPVDVTNTEDLVDFFGPLTGAPQDNLPQRVFVPLPELFRSGALFDIEAFVDEVGFSPGEITTFAALDSPPARFIVVRGVTLKSGLPEVAPGVGTIGEGEDFVSILDERTAARQLGRPLRVAELDGNVALSLATDPLVDWVGEETYRTLADHQVLGAVAFRLDEEAVVSAVLVTNDEAVYEGVGIGWQAESKPGGVIVLAYGSEAIAQEQLPLVEAGFAGESLGYGRPMSELITVENLDVRGSEIVITMSFPDDRPPNTILNLLYQRDVPFAAPG